jgi:hypothetical protein
MDQRSRSGRQWLRAFLCSAVRTHAEGYRHRLVISKPGDEAEAAQKKDPAQNWTGSLTK